jgi:cytochrome c oxidase subunit 2
MTRRSLLSAAAVLALLLLARLGAAPRAAEPQVIEIVAKRFQFAPSQLTLRKDQPVLLRLRSEDVTHGFFSKPLGIDAVIVPGQVTEIAVTPQQAGKYPIICDHFCGSGHGGMKLTLLVE